MDTIHDRDVPNADDDSAVPNTKDHTIRHTKDLPTPNKDYIIPIPRVGEGSPQYQLLG